MTLKDMVFQNLNPNAGEQNTSSVPPNTNVNPSAVVPGSGHKLQVKSPETPSGSEPEDENQEAVVIFTKGIRKFSRNKPGTADSNEDGTSGQDLSKEEQN